MRIPRTTSRIGAVATALVPAVLTALLLLSTPATAFTADSGRDVVAPATWAAHSPAAAPPGRSHAAMAFDPATGTFVLFGGNSGTQVLDDTWTWDGSVWTSLSPPTSPPPLELASLVYDSGSHKLLLFGGRGGDGQPTNGTWSWDGATWLQLNPVPSPPPRYGASVAPEAANGMVVLFGGLSSPTVALSDTWTWNGANWAQAAPSISPDARGMAAATLDAARGVVVLFGGTTGSTGSTGSTTLGDTWTWDGAAWTRHTSATLPWPRYDAAMAYDPVTQKSILFGGSGPPLPFGDTWLWDGTSWSISGLGVFGPPARSGASLAGASGSQRPVLFGGQADKALGDTWSFAATPATTSPPSTGVTATSAPPTTVRGATTSVPTTVRPPGPPKSSPPGVATTTPSSQAKGAPLAVTARTIQPGGLLTLSGSGFAPNEKVQIILHSSTTFRTEARTDASGTFHQTLEVPSTVSPGSHQIEARGPAMGGGEALTLVASIQVTGPGAKHGWLLPASMIGLTVLLAGAATLVLAASARWQRRPSTESGG